MPETERVVFKEVHERVILCITHKGTSYLRRKFLSQRQKELLEIISRSPISFLGLAVLVDDPLAKIMEDLSYLEEAGYIRRKEG